MRLLGIDFGQKRVGVSITDESGKMAFPHAVYGNDQELLTKVVALIEEKQVAEIVIGYSLDKEGKPNAVHEAVEEFITSLTLETGLPIHLEPEQYTTQAALRIQGRNDMTDAAAATLILDNYLSHR
ncbi:MAG: Holliday junction resolvase RuvX [Candidatus Nomurabacteria bacterium]|nr:Holliday junction resolvase RuvX [Candidatus Nomurabacteria bacterium]USN88282.1 MAG: Holliday junction resolvase RuvX [Candidatus Nomurabacteria bacterium]